MEVEKKYHIGLRKGDVGRYILLPGDPGRTEIISRHFDKAEKKGDKRGFVTYTGEVDGIKISTTSTGIGCPAVAICLEELLDIGADTFIRVGTAGSLQEHIGINNLVVATGSVREDGTSRQYIPLSYPAVPDLEVTNALLQAAKELNLPLYSGNLPKEQTDFLKSSNSPDFAVHYGIVHCKDALYTEGKTGLPMEQENKRMWEIWQKANVLATSMEDGILFTLSSIRKVWAGEILTIVGLTYDEHKIFHMNTRTDEAIEMSIKVAIRAVKILEKIRTSKH